MSNRVSWCGTFQGLRVTPSGQTQSFCGATQFLEAPAGALARAPIRPLAQPTEMEINSCHFEGGLKTAWRALGPACAFVLGHTLPHEPGPPRPVSQSRQVNLARGDRCRFPIGWINPTTAHDNVVLVVFAVNNHLRRGLQEVEQFACPAA